MKILIYRGNIDDLKTDFLVLPFYHDERPLKSINGIIDWRLYGKISNLIQNHVLQGNLLEKAIFSPKSKIKTSKFYLLGLGVRSELTEKAIQDVIDDILKTIVNLKIKNFAIPLGKLANENIPFGRVSEIFINDLINAKSKTIAGLESCFLIVRHGEEMKELAATLKSLDGNVPMDIEIKVTSESSEVGT